MSSIDIPLTSKYWWADGCWLNQGKSPKCAAFAWTHWVMDGPVIQNLPYSTDELYQKFQENDGIIREEIYHGTTIRAGAKVLKKLGLISEYRCSKSTEEITNILLNTGPIVVGTKWYHDMNYPDSNGIMHVNGKQIGGHAYVLNGIDINSGQYRIKNSWGKRWGKDGFGYISITEFQTLLDNGGEACIAIEKKLDILPDINSVLSEDIN